MLATALTRRHVLPKVQLTVKFLVSLLTITLAVTLPQMVHLFAGASGGVTWLPMYLPVLLGGCVLGARWGLATGLLAPLASYLITSSFGNPMPAAARLPFMMAELAVFAFVCGLFSKKIVAHRWLAFPAVIAAQVSGRLFFLASIALFGKYASFTTGMIWNQIKTGLPGLAVQAVFVPLIVMVLPKLLCEEKNN